MHVVAELFNTKSYQKHNFFYKNIWEYTEYKYIFVYKTSLVFSDSLGHPVI